MCNSQRPNLERIREARGQYVENVTAAIFAELTDVIRKDIKDSTFLNAQERVRKVIDRETLWKDAEE